MPRLGSRLVAELGNEKDAQQLGVEALLNAAVSAATLPEWEEEVGPDLLLGGGGAGAAPPPSPPAAPPLPRPPSAPARDQPFCAELSPNWV